MSSLHDEIFTGVQSSFVSSWQLIHVFHQSVSSSRVERISYLAISKIDKIEITTE
jgi:hypothetical protein